VPVMNNILALLTITGGGTDTLNLTDTGSDSGTLGANSLTGFFGPGGSMNYAGIETMNFAMGNGPQTLTISGRSGFTNITSGAGADVFNILGVSGTTNIDAGTGVNTFNVGSSIFNVGSGQMNKVQG